MKHRPGDRVRNHAFPRRTRRTGQFTGSLSVDGGPADKVGRSVVCAEKSERRNDDLDSSANRTEDSRTVIGPSRICIGSGRQQHVGEHVSAKLIHGAGVGGDDFSLLLVLRSARRARIDDGACLLGEPIVDGVGQQSGQGCDQVGHSVSERYHTHSALLARIAVTLEQGAGMHPLGE